MKAHSESRQKVRGFFVLFSCAAGAGRVASLLPCVTFKSI